MTNLTRDFFIALSNNQFLNENAKRWGFRLGAEKFVAGTDLPHAAERVKELNERGISVALDNLGEFVFDRSEADAAKNKILQVIEYIHQEKLDGHITVKLTQIGLDIDQNFCMNNMREILAKASGYNIFVNIDMEKYIHYQPTLDIVTELHKEYKNIGTVLQSYLYRTLDDLEGLKDVRLRIVKGAYKESEEVAYQTKEEVDANFMAVVKERLQGETFTSIATHDHNLINKVKKYAEEQQIDKANFEFQMLYGFRVEMQHALAKEGYNFCTYIPFGEDWYGYFMRRLAERPQNINLVLKDTFYTEDNKLKKGPIAAGIAGIAALTFIAGRKSRRNKLKRSVTK